MFVREYLLLNAIFPDFDFPTVGGVPLGSAVDAGYPYGESALPVGDCVNCSNPVLLIAPVCQVEPGRDM